MKDSTYPDPKTYEFSDFDREKYGKRHYQFPCRLVTEGHWSELWQPRGKRGGGGIASILPVLALQSYPGAPTIAGNQVPAPSPGFTPWAYLGCRRLGTIAGIHYDSARRAMQDIARLGWAEIRTVSPAGRGGHQVWFSLSEKLFPGDGEAFRVIPGDMIYSGTWGVLPTSASRHVYLTLAVLDPVRDEERLKAAFDDQHGIDEPEEQYQKIERMREASAVSQSELRRLTGMSRSTLEEALSILITPLFKSRSIPLIRTHRGRTGSRWYSINSEGQTWYFVPDTLNETSGIEVVRRQLWPGIKRRTRPSKRRKSRKAA